MSKTIHVPGLGLPSSDHPKAIAYLRLKEMKAQIDFRLGQLSSEALNLKYFVIDDSDIGDFREYVGASLGLDRLPLVRTFGTQPDFKILSKTIIELLKDSTYAKRLNTESEPDWIDGIRIPLYSLDDGIDELRALELKIDEFFAVKNGEAK